LLPLDLLLCGLRRRRRLSGRLRRARTWSRAARLAAVGRLDRDLSRPRGGDLLKIEFQNAVAVLGRDMLGVDHLADLEGPEEVADAVFLQQRPKVLVLHAH